MLRTNKRIYHVFVPALQCEKDSWHMVPVYPLPWEQNTKLQLKRGCFMPRSCPHATISVCMSVCACMGVVVSSHERLPPPLLVMFTAISNRCSWRSHCTIKNTSLQCSGKPHVSIDTIKRVIFVGCQFSVF